MKNEVKLNSYLFLPELQNNEISAEQAAAWKLLLDLPPLAANSIEKFTAELESRLALIKPILADQTEDFLGYDSDDIVKLSDFFSGKFEKFGMAAVAVQKILRSVWLQTPCDDKRLNYEIFQFVDNKFYSIVNKAKKDVSFEHIPEPTSLTDLKNDWEIRRAHYAERLGIDLDYLNGEAIDGTIFPSASGLFANPTSPQSNSPHAVLEFLNFWMPHCQVCGEDLLDPSHFRHPAKEFFKIRKLYPLYWGYFTKPFKDNEDFFIQLKQYKELHFFSTLSDSLDSETILLNESNAALFWKKSKNIFLQSIRAQYKSLQPTRFWQECREGLYEIRGKRYSGIETDNKQLPQFINSCMEYLLCDGCIRHSDHLELFVNESQGQKLYLPTSYFKEVLELYSAGFSAIAAPLPNPDADNIEEQLEKYKKHCDALYDPDDEFANKLSGWGSLCESAWNQKVSQFWSARPAEFWNIVRDYFDKVANSDLNISNRIQALETIKEYFCPDNYDIYRMRAEQYKLNKCMTKKIRDIKEEKKLPPRTILFCDSMEYISRIDELAREQEKLKLQAKEAEIRAQVQKDNFVTINHSMKNLMASIDGALSRLERRLPSEQEFMCNLLRQAKQGVVIASDLANAITCSYRSTGTELWHEDLLPENAKWSIRNILRDALSASVPHMFFRRYSQYEKESKNYFPCEDVAVNAENQWYDFQNIDDRINWINQNLFHITLDDEEVANCKVGNKYSTKTHLYVLFNEILLNAVKAASFVTKEQRFVDIKLTSENDNIHVDISNSATSANVSGGYGKMIIDNYRSVFNMVDFYSGYNEKTQCYQVKFTLPFFK